MQFSYWEYKTWLSNIDFTIIGSGIVGLNTALMLRKKYPKAEILILEKGSLPQGASTKNAGFACFGSLSEVLSDLEHHPEEEVIELVAKRWEGIKLLRNTLGDTQIDFQENGGHELFFENNEALYEKCEQNLETVNKLLFPIFRGQPFYKQANRFNFKGIKENYITHRFEGQIDTGLMMRNLLALVQKKGINILNSICVEEIADNKDHVEIKTNLFEFKTKKAYITTNGFAAQLIKEKIMPARAQILITKPIDNLHIKGTFHLDEGYYYFRNIDDRILFGGGRNLDIKGEETTEFGQTTLIQNRLETILKETILPNTNYEIDRRWSGIMGMGTQKKPIVKQLSDNVFCGVRLGGMGIAIGSLVGKELANL